MRHDSIDTGKVNCGLNRRRKRRNQGADNRLTMNNRLAGTRQQRGASHDAG